VWWWFLFFFVVFGSDRLYVLWKPSIAPLLNTVIGDASKPLLGVSEEEFHHLADRVDSIRHAGALVDWYGR
jgi:thioester reductase-like protein